VQVKLLRVLQEREIERLGAQERIAVDVRLVAATKIDLADAVREGDFREDLYYRLNVVPVKLPPLREREGDVRLLSDHFIERYGAGRRFEIAEEVMEKMERFTWPGNVRQLENAIERSIALAGDSPSLREEHLLWDLRTGPVAANGAGRVQTLDEARREAEIRTIRTVLEHTDGHKAQSAKILGISRKNLWEKMRDYGID
jgi:transcriptional regulator with PAS, ATPase and Fis domain